MYRLQHCRQLIQAARLDRAAHSGNLRRCAMTHRIDQRQGRLAFREVIPHVFADDCMIATVIQYIVNQLKSRTQVSAVTGDSRFRLSIRPAQ